MHRADPVGPRQCSRTGTCTKAGACVYTDKNSAASSMSDVATYSDSVRHANCRQLMSSFLQAADYHASASPFEVQDIALVSKYPVLLEAMPSKCQNVRESKEDCLKQWGLKQMVSFVSHSKMGDALRLILYMLSSRFRRICILRDGRRTCKVISSANCHSC
eukprot:IDg4315t1